MDTVKRNEESPQLDPGSGAFTSYADELCSRGLWAEAVRACRRNLTFQPQHLHGRVLLGWALKELGEWDEAEKVLREAAAEIQRNALLFSLLAEIAKKGGDLKQAELFLDICQNLRAAALEPSSPAEAKPGADFSADTEPSATATLLASLLARFETMPVKTPNQQRIFSEEEREMLTRILKSHGR